MFVFRGFRIEEAIIKELEGFEALLSIYPNAQLQVLEGVGHWHSLEDPAAVTAQLVEFLTKP